MIKLIVATGLNGEIGKDGELPWEDDLLYMDDNIYFKNKIKNNIIVGTNNSVSYSTDYKSFLVSRNSYLNWSLLSPDMILNSVQDSFPEKDVYVVGGVEWYHSSSPYVEKAYISIIKNNFPDSTSIVDREILTKDKTCIDVYDFNTWEIQVWEK